jgi:hypothetical protein
MIHGGMLCNCCERTVRSSVEPLTSKRRSQLPRDTNVVTVASTASGITLRVLVRTTEVVPRMIHTLLDSNHRR